ncbi:threonine aldolase family protein [Solicola gregarius]|uniref:Threonine aldolase family protein n=1 Tax=Solicola gregarius TaxID=2908642 RepID=A0AA46TJ02_9ACTN|nr:threonine aldolase family protein [Solicola gregarius]UYM05378.1 threonine aldolase family protein [Solicola gregarius]
MIDLRSDTVTTPTDAMRRAIANADVGDDVYGEDPSVNALEERVAQMFGHEAALYCVSGSLANLLAVRAVTPVGAEVLCDSRAHIVRAESGAHAAIGGVTTRTWTHSRGLAAVDEIDALVAPASSYFVSTATISVENTHNFGGGLVHSIDSLRAVRERADAQNLSVHLDGARIWNAHVATGVPLTEYGGVADVLAVCLSKGLGAPVGSLVIGSREHIAEAREWRRRLGAAWRQAGVLAAAGHHALDHHIDRLADDHAHAQLVAEACGIDPASVESNIVVVPGADARAVVEAARAEGVLIGAIDPRTVRLLTHLDVSRADAERAANVLARALKQGGLTPPRSETPPYRKPADESEDSMYDDRLLPHSQRLRRSPRSHR